VLLEFPRRFQQVRRGGELHPRLGKGIRLAVVAIQQRLGIERVDVRRAAFHEQKDDPLGPRRQMRRFGCERILLGRFACLSEQGGERQRAEADRGAGEELAARKS
jgi:hypothetical protein